MSLLTCSKKKKKIFNDQRMKQGEQAWKKNR